MGQPGIEIITAATIHQIKRHQVQTLVPIVFWRIFYEFLMPFNKAWVLFQCFYDKVCHFVVVGQTEICAGVQISPERCEDFASGGVRVSV